MVQQPINSGFAAKSEPHDILKGIDLTGKNAIVTGGYSGIGLETVRALTGAGARVWVPARRVEQASAGLKGVISGDRVKQMDLMDLDSVRAFAAGYLASGEPLHLLINNAGIMACPEQRTEQGWDLQFAVNHIGHFVLTMALLPA
ncbi:MAG: SDR family NAD(P)-dependent oxidoreductase, partial [Gammaproteobacteria bacterium]